MSDDRIYEIARLMEDPENLSRDIYAAGELVSRHFYNKYVMPLKEIFNKHAEMCAEKPSKEMVFLHSCRPFIPHRNMDMFEKAVDIFSALEVINSINSAYTAHTVTAASISDSALHPDGVYEVDKSCMVGYSSVSSTGNMDTAVMLLALFFLIRR